MRPSTPTQARRVPSLEQPAATCSWIRAGQLRYANPPSPFRRFDLLLYVCVSVVLSLRAPLLSAPDFSTAIKALQRPDAWPPLHALLVSALALYQRDHAPKEHGKENDEADLVLGEMMGHAREAYPGGRGGGEPGGAEPAGGVAGESDGDRAGAMSGEGGLGRRK